MRRTLTSVTALFLLSGSAVHALGQTASDTDTLVVPDVVREPFTGDLPQIRKRGILRAGKSEPYRLLP